MAVAPRIEAHEASSVRSSGPVRAPHGRAARLRTAVTRPYVLVNMAMSADGKTDSVERRGLRLSSEADVARVFSLRERSDAVLVGGRTLRSEDPRLTVRGAADARTSSPSERYQPMKVAVVSRLDGPGTAGGLPIRSRFLADGGAPVVFFTTGATRPRTRQWLRSQGAEVHIGAGALVDLQEVLRNLRDRGVERLLVEGGGTLVAALVAEGLVDEVRVYVAPLLLGGAGAPTPLDGPGLPPDAAVRLRLEGVSPDPGGGVLLRYVLGAWIGPRPYDPSTGGRT